MAENGDHEKIRRAADTAILILSARLMTVVGVPLAGFIAVQAYIQLSSINEKLDNHAERIVIIEQKQTAADNRDNNQDQRINRLEDRVFINR